MIDWGDARLVDVLPNPTLEGNRPPLDVPARAVMG